MATSITANMGQYAQLRIRGKVHYHADVTINEGGSAKNLTGYTNFKLELKAKGDEDGDNIATVALTADTLSSGTLDIDITSANTTTIQAGSVHEGVYDAIATNGSSEIELLFHGDWVLIKGVTE
tara:strand:- start:75 stop:446 length:372 start_codon:yes stop_codon:yes gene_type:complete